jgi:hypothetical protein
VVTGYTLTLTGGADPQTYTTGPETTLSTPVALDLTKTYSVTVKANGKGIQGPDSAAASVAMPTISEAPTIGAARYDGVTLFVGWSAVANPVVTGYTLTLTGGESPQTYTTGPETTLSTPVALDLTKTYSVRVKANGNGIQGPDSKKAAVTMPTISEAPTIGTARYDGVTLFVDWSPVANPLVTGYTLTLTGGESPQTYITGTETSFSILVTLDPAKTYSLTVRADGRGIHGPDSAPVNPNVMGTLFFLSDYTVDVLPYLYRSGALPPAKADFELYLPELFNTPPATLPKSLTSPGNNSPFVMSKTSDTRFPYKLSVSQSSQAWSFDASTPPIRTALRADYVNFLKALETVSGGMIPGTIPFLQQIIARSFPLTFSETLYYAYGYDPASRYCNLQAGMRARVDYEMYQFVGPGGVPLQNGMVGNATSYYHLGDYLMGADQSSQSLEVGFNNFLSKMAVSIPTPSGGGAGLLDTYIAGLRQPFLRLFYPSSFESADKAGWTDTTKNVALVAAQSFADMDTATNNFINGQPFPANVYVTFLRGRAAVVPEIEVTVNGNRVYVPVGSAIRNLIQQQTDLPLRGKTGTGQTMRLGRFQYARSVENVINHPSEIPDLSPLHRANNILFSYKNLITYSNGTDCFDLPVLHGDMLTY